MAAMHDSAFLDSRDFARIARAIRYIDANFRAQPRLAAIAAQARLSEFHFNRLFRRWAGVTPRQYLAFVTARAARAALASTPSVLEASFAVGLSGPSRLHDLMVTLDGVTPGELKGGGFGLQLDCGFSDTPFGRALLASTARGVSHLSFVEPGTERAALAELAAQWPLAQLRRDDPAAAALAARIWDAPAHATAPLRLAVRGTNFQLKVWEALLETHATGPTSYQALAGAAGAAAGARAVGNAVGSNPVAWLIPCHNVLLKDGSLGGYRWGADRKRAMLAWQTLHPRAAGSVRLGAAASP
jgi:AraC family transcriptional regulator, regulatory protein of adaptative response / methylated-DNA-[protein]-cysteine methyltransferase